MNSRPILYQGEEFEQPVLTPKHLAEGKTKPNLRRRFSGNWRRESNKANETLTNKQGAASKEVEKTGSRHAEQIDVPKASPHFSFFNNQIST